MRLDKALLIARKDWREAFSSRAMLASLLFCGLMLVVLPPLMLVPLALAPDVGQYMTEKEVAELKAILPEAAQMDMRQLLAYMVGALLTPFFFIIVSLVSISVLASDSFAGEKERKTIEPLLAAPISDSELFLGKVLASFLPSSAITYASFALSCVLINSLTADLFGGLWFPPLKTLLAVCLLAPAYAFLGMCLIVLGSARASTVKEASNYSGVLIIPVLVAFLGSIFGGIALRASYIVVATLAVVALDVVLVRMARRAFNREALVLSYR